MNKTHLITHCYLLVTIYSTNCTYSQEINNVTKGINSITNALGSAALSIKKTYDQIDPQSVNTNKAIAESNVQAKDLDAKIDAIIAGVKKWMAVDSNTKQQALQALQRNVDVINKEVEKAKKQLEIANAAAEKVSAKDKAKFTDAIQGAANAVTANTQYYMATKTRLDYEQKYKELIDTRNRRLDVIKKINDPSVIQELLSDSNDLSDKKYAEQLRDYTDQDAKLRDKLSQDPNSYQTQPVTQNNQLSQNQPNLPNQTQQPVTQNNQLSQNQSNLPNQTQQPVTQNNQLSQNQPNLPNQTQQPVTQNNQLSQNQSNLPNQIQQPVTQNNQLIAPNLNSQNSQNIQTASNQTSLPETQTLAPQHLKNQTPQQLSVSDSTTVWNNVNVLPQSPQQTNPAPISTTQNTNNPHLQPMAHPSNNNLQQLNNNSLQTNQSGLLSQNTQTTVTITTPESSHAFNNAQNTQYNQNKKQPTIASNQTKVTGAIVNLEDITTKKVKPTILKSNSKQKIKITNVKNNNTQTVNVGSASVRQSSNTVKNMPIQKIPLNNKQKKLPSPGLLASLPSDNLIN